MARELLNKDGSPMRSYQSKKIEELLNEIDSEETEKIQSETLKKQTATEWLIDRIVQDQLHRDISHKVWIEIFEQANAKFEQQIAEAWNDGNLLGRNGNVLEEYDTGKQYYKKTYGIL